MALKTALLATMAIGLSGPLTMVAAQSNDRYLGCYREGTGARALSGPSATSSWMTTWECRKFCAGFRLFGVEYGTECYCGTRLGAGSYQVPESACDTPCGGDGNQTCGGSNLLSVYKTNFTSQNPEHAFAGMGCYSEPPGARALDRVLSSPLMTTRKCLVVCGYSSYAYAGLEYGSECWCGLELHGAAARAPDGACDMPCTGNASETCGGSEALSLYQNTRGAPGARNSSWTRGSLADPHQQQDL